ncbi:MAG: hypothetical protein ACXVBU_03155 [Ktedonobacteraceae bacterium]
MLDQNITTLLSTLLGGLLTIVGGFLANYYIQSTSNKTEKRKEKKTRIEQLYLLSNDIRQTFYRLEFNQVSDADWTSEFLRVNKVESDMEMMVMLYVPELTEVMYTYLKSILSMTATFEGIHDNEIGEEIEEATKKFQYDLAGLLEKLGYS